MRIGLALLLLAGTSAFAGPSWYRFGSGYRGGLDYAIGSSRRAPRYLTQYYGGQRLHANAGSSYHRAVWHLKHFESYRGAARRAYARAYPYGFPGGIYPDDLAYWAFNPYKPYGPLKIAPMLTSMTVAWSLDDPVFDGPEDVLTGDRLPEIRTKPVGERFLVDS